MDKITLNAYGKINLGLDVIGKRPDGYHELKMIMQTVGLCDTLEMRKQAEGITIRTNKKYLPTNEKNLIYQAVKLLTDEFKIQSGVAVKLSKVIPVAAGMAGGSTDCAAALTGMNKLFNLGLSKEELAKRGVKIGADVPYCIMGGTMLAEGIGDILTPLRPAPRCRVLLVKPNIFISTKWVYQNLNIDNLEKHPDIDGIIKAINENDLLEMGNQLDNVLESVTIAKYPIIQKIKDNMLSLGAVSSLMSGSGPTVFGLFDDEKKALTAYEAFKKSKYIQNVFLTELKN